MSKKLFATCLLMLMVPQVSFGMESTQPQSHVSWLKKLAYVGAAVSALTTVAVVAVPRINKYLHDLKRAAGVEEFNRAEFRALFQVFEELELQDGEDVKSEVKQAKQLINHTRETCIQMIKLAQEPHVSLVVRQQIINNIGELRILLNDLKAEADYFISLGVYDERIDKWILAIEEVMARWEMPGTVRSWIK